MSVIFADTCCDLDSKQVKKLNINLVDLEKKDLTESFKKAFQPYLDDEEDIIYLSTNLSKVNESFTKAVKYFSGLYDKRIIKSIDLNSVSTCAGLVVYEAGLMYKRGSTDLQITKFVDEFTSQVYALIISQDKELLSKCQSNDKINVNSISNLISPIIFAKSNTFEILDKAQGKKRAITNICKILSEKCVNIADYPLIIGYGDDETNAEYLKNALIKQFGDDTVVLLQRLSGANEQLFGKNGLIVSFYSKKIR